MKKILLSVCLIATSVFAFAQKPADGDNSLTFGITGINTIALTTPHYTNTLLYKHYMSNGLAARVGINIGTSSSSTSTVNGGDSLKSSSMNWALTLGVQKAFKGTDKLETYIGADLMLGGGSSSNTTNFSSTFKVENKAGSTFKFGIIPCIGMNYYIASWLAVGAEFGWGFVSSSTAAGSQTTTISGTSTTTNTGKSSNTTLGTSGSGMLTVTAAFR